MSLKQLNGELIFSYGYASSENQDWSGRLMVEGVLRYLSGPEVKALLNDRY
jgi:hypothetical protein